MDGKDHQKLPTSTSRAEKYSRRRIRSASTPVTDYVPAPITPYLPIQHTEGDANWEEEYGSENANEPEMRMGDVALLDALHLRVIRGQM